MIELTPVINLPKFIKISVNRWKLTKDWSIYGYTVPKGFEFNGASVPKSLQWIVSPDGVLLVPSILHDYMYINAIDTKAKADYLFFKLCLKSKVNLPLSLIAYLGVSIVGNGSY